MSTSVGAITFDLIIDPKQLQRELAKVRDTASKGLTGPMKKVGSDIGDALAQPVKSAGKEIEKSLSGVQQTARQTQKEIAEVVRRSVEAEKARRKALDTKETPVRQAEVGKSTLASTVFAEEDRKNAQELQAAMERADAAAKEYAESLRASVSPFELLRAKQDDLNAQIESQIEKIRVLAREAELVRMGKADGDLSKLDDQIAQARSKLISLQGSAAATGEKIQAAMDKAAQPAKQVTKETSKAATNIKRMGAEAAKTGNQSKKAFSGATSAAGKFGKMIRSSLKSVLIMSVLYKGFKAIRDYMAGAATQNKAFSDSLKQIKGNLATAFQPIFNAVLPALTALANGVAKVTGYIAAAIAALFGTTYQKAAEGAKKLTKQTQAAGDAAKKSTASFDELNILSDPSGGGDAEADSASAALYEEPDISWADKLKDKLAEASEYFMTNLGGDTAFDTLLTAKDRFVENMQTAAENVKTAMAPIFDGVAQSWQKNIPNVESGISGFVNGTANRVATFTTIVGGTVKAATEGAKNFVKENEPQIKGLIDRTITNTTTGFANLGTAYENITKTVGGFVTGFFEQNSPYIEGFCETVIDAFWNVAQPVIDFFSGIWNDITAAIKEFSENPALENFLTAIQNLLVALQPLWNALCQNVQFGADLIGAQLNIVLGALRGILNGIWQFIKANLITGINNLTSVVEVITALLRGEWSKAWELAKEGAVTALKGIVNQFSAFLNIFVHGINGLIEGLNKIKVDIPDWVPGFGGKSFGFNIGWRMPEIPMLASGGVVDQPTLSMIGESGKEAVVPLENNTGWMATLAQYIAQAIASTGSSDTEKEIVIRFEGTMAQLARQLKPYLDADTKRMGVRLVQGG